MRLIDADKLPYVNKVILVDKSDGDVKITIAKEHTSYVNDETPTVEAIPIEWIVDWLTRQHIPATHTCDDYYAVEMMLDDWEKENGSY